MKKENFEDFTEEIKQAVDNHFKEPYKNRKIAEIIDVRYANKDPRFIRGYRTMDCVKCITDSFKGCTLDSANGTIVLTPEERVKYIECNDRKDFLHRLIDLQDRNGLVFPWLVYVDCFLPTDCSEVFQIYLAPHKAEDTVNDVAIFMVKHLLSTGVPCLVFGSSDTFELLQASDEK